MILKNSTLHFRSQISAGRPRRLDIFMIMAGEKIAHLYLGWVANPDLLKRNWKLDARRFLAVDTNIKQVAKSAGLCHSPNTSVIRAHLNELLDAKGMHELYDSKKLEIALLYVGQEYCKGQERKHCRQSDCPFY